MQESGFVSAPVFFITFAEKNDEYERAGILSFGDRM